MPAERFVHNGVPVYSRFNLMSKITDEIVESGQDLDSTFDTVLATVRALEDRGIIEITETSFSKLFVVQDWEKML